MGRPSVCDTRAFAQPRIPETEALPDDSHSARESLADVQVNPLAAVSRCACCCLPDRHDSGGQPRPYLQLRPRAFKDDRPLHASTNGEFVELTRPPLPLEKEKDTGVEQPEASAVPCCALLWLPLL